MTAPTTASTTASTTAPVTTTAEHGLSTDLAGADVAHDADDTSRPTSTEGVGGTDLFPAVRERIYLSPPDLRGPERALLLDALDSNWVAPLGPHVDAFEAEAAAACGRFAAAATVSGTAALHLALRLVGVVVGDEVLMPTLSFVATANAARYLGAEPVFLDVDAESWTLDPVLLADELARRAASGVHTAAVIAVDLYGQCADYDALTRTCGDYDVPLVVDAAESLGASYEGRPAGSAGVLAVLSFNGNKIVTSGGGGMLLADDEELAAKARFWSTQAREPGVGYLHEELGYNYRLSNLLAAVGRGQLAGLGDRVAARRAIFDRYEAALATAPGVSFLPRSPRGEINYWLTCLLLDPAQSPVTPSDVVSALAAHDIEARPTWAPLHSQPLYAGRPFISTGVAEQIAARGLCLPSGSGLRADQQDRVISVLDRLLRTA